MAGQQFLLSAFHPQKHFKVLQRDTKSTGDLKSTQRKKCSNISIKKQKLIETLKKERLQLVSNKVFTKELKVLIQTNMKLEGSWFCIQATYG